MEESDIRTDQPEHQRSEKSLINIRFSEHDNGDRHIAGDDKLK